MLARMEMSRKVGKTSQKVEGLKGIREARVTVSVPILLCIFASSSTPLLSAMGRADWPREVIG